MTQCIEISKKVISFTKRDEEHQGAVIVKSTLKEKNAFVKVFINSYNDFIFLPNEMVLTPGEEKEIQITRKPLPFNIAKTDKFLFVSFPTEPGDDIEEIKRKNPNYKENGNKIVIEAEYSEESQTDKAVTEAEAPKISRAETEQSTSNDNVSEKEVKESKSEAESKPIKAKIPEKKKGNLIVVLLFLLAAFSLRFFFAKK